MTDIYLVRHAQTEWSANGRYTSYTDLALTPDGEAAARALRDRLARVGFDQVWTSPRARARDTAELAGFDPGTLIVDEDLAEWNYGQYEGRTRAEITEAAPGWTIWDNGAPGGESPDQVRERCQRMITKLLDTGAGRVLVFGHGHALRALMLIWIDLDLTRGERFPLATSTISQLGTYKQVRALVTWNAG